MGVLMVVGIAVSNGILLVDDANRRFGEGADEVDAVVAHPRREVHSSPRPRPNTRDPGGTDFVSHTLPPMTESLPITVSPPRMVAPA